MATYLELSGASSDADKLAVVSMALVIACNAVAEDAVNLPEGDGMNTANHRLWARYTLDRPQDEARRAWSIILAKYNDVPLSTIEGVSDSIIQGLVDGIVPYLVASRADR